MIYSIVASTAISEDSVGNIIHLLFLKELLLSNGCFWLLDSGPPPSNRRICRTVINVVGLSLLEATAEGIFWNHPEFGHRIRVDVPQGCETCPLEAHSESRQQSEVTQREIRRVRWLARCVIVVQQPLVTPFPLQNLHKEFTCNAVQAVRTHCAANRL
jgi:hypothetical protein